MRHLRNVTIAASSVVACFAFAACSAEPPRQLGGHDVTDLAGSLADISARWRATLAGLGPTANLPAGARCYVEGTGGQALGSSVVCGPVRLAGDGETTWQSHAVVGSNTPSGVRLVLAGGDSGAAAPTFRPRAEVDLTSNFVDADGMPVPLNRAASAWAWLDDVTMGFSMNTCRPASAASMACSKCSVCGVMIATASSWASRNMVAGSVKSRGAGR